MSAPGAVELLITGAQSWDFACLSGDFNPLHVDPVHARRTQFGGTVTHGIHLLLKSMDIAVELGQLDLACVEAIAVQFSNPARSEIRIDLKILSDPVAAKLRLVGESEGRALFSCTLTLGGRRPGRIPSGGALPFASRPPLPISFDSLEAQFSSARSVPLQLDPALFDGLFPALAREAGHRMAMDLLATTNIVGMECPGLHSIFSGLKLTRRTDVATDDPVRMPYSLQKADARFRLIRLAVSGCCYEGTLEALFRPAPVAQSTLQEIARLVPEGIYAHQTALVVGGSRGLGELTAKILLAGGAKVTITYARGQSDAARIAQEATAMGCECDTRALDLAQQDDAGSRDWMREGHFTHAYFFASPHISRSPNGHWHQPLFEDYTRFYLDGFAQVVRMLSAGNKPGSQALKLLYPSTVFLDAAEKGFAEYCCAKAAGEALCDHLALQYAAKVHRPRLPRLRTDQTSGLADSLLAEPFPVIRDAINHLDRI